MAWADGGAEVSAARRPLLGADDVSHWFLGVIGKPGTQGVTVQATRVNGEPRLLATVVGTPVGAVSLDIADGRIAVLRLIVNPSKLPGLQP